VIFYSLTYEIPINTWFAPRFGSRTTPRPIKIRDWGALCTTILCAPILYLLLHSTVRTVLWRNYPSILPYINRRKVFVLEGGLVGEVGMRGGAELIPRNRNYFM
jgi:hypothetical protein